MFGAILDALGGGGQQQQQPSQGVAVAPQAKAPGAVQNAVGGLFNPSMMPMYMGMLLGGTRQDQGRLAMAGLDQGLGRKQQQSQFEASQAFSREQFEAQERARRERLAIERARLEHAMQPKAYAATSALGKLRQDYINGALGDPNSDDAKATYEAGKDKILRAASGMGLTIGADGQISIGTGAANPIVGGSGKAQVIQRGKQPTGMETVLDPLTGQPRQVMQENAASLPAETVGKLAYLEVAKPFLEEAKAFYRKGGGYDTGDRARKAGGNLPGIGRFIQGGEVQRADRPIDIVVESALRFATGASYKDVEIQDIADKFKPAWDDGWETINQKIAMLEVYMEVAGDLGTRGKVTARDLERAAELEMANRGLINKPSDVGSGTSAAQPDEIRYNPKTGGFDPIGGN